MTDPTLAEIMERVKAGWPTAPRHADALVTEIERQASEIERLREALRVFAADDSWRVTTESLTDRRYAFVSSHPVYATPWGVARAALNEKEPDADA